MFIIPPEKDSIFFLIKRIRPCCKKAKAQISLNKVIFRQGLLPSSLRLYIIVIPAK
jgi:hypothetical protein